ncbi:hypothetical protein SCLCIDRAFT_24456 [Scleroderma citrinum Foug A]|uniref:CCHC-type domain-containing protein n=1 Tax=Scleroderma citrinum Foug A TaxID=1036808 RepID=A0A0C3E4Y7_9AGAM|nr:hypothetical protein SCLCIDRAFT_24456 [Scleroderma citrinum Foug A]
MSALQKFHEWWSKVKVWINTTHATATDQQKVAAVYSRLEGPHAGHFVQVRLDECMVAGAWPTWATLQAEIKAFFLPGNNKEWARSQLLRLCQGPCQRIDDFLAQFQALNLQSECPDEYAKDLLERAVSCKILEQVYMQGLDRTTWLQVREAVRTVGRAQELFLINTTPPTQYFGTNYYTSSASTPSGSGVLMDIGAANTQPQHGKGIQCYNCQGFGHISHRCTQPQWAQQQSPQQGWAVQPQVDPHHEDKRVKAVREKTCKKVATVSSPVSVSPNKYTSLVVEGVDTQCTMDCADTTASFVSFTSTVPSIGVPRSGPAPDVKRGVCNSCVLINGQKSPSLASSDLESPANDLEVGFLVELRWTITMEREVQIPVSHTKYSLFKNIFIGLKHLELRKRKIADVIPHAGYYKFKKDSDANNITVQQYYCKTYNIHIK